MSDVTEVFRKYLGDSEADKQALEAERLIVDVTEDILREMDRRGVKKVDLARKLHKSKSFVSSTLDGSRNLTLRTLSQIAYVLGLKARVQFIDHAENYAAYPNVVRFVQARDFENVINEIQFSQAATQAEVANW